MAYERNGKVLKNLDTNEEKHFEFVNEAKRESRKIQQQGKGLGNGDVKLTNK